MDRATYRKNPCGMLSIPYWKHQTFPQPKGIVVVHETEYDETTYPPHARMRYFRLCHHLREPLTPDPRVQTIDPLEDGDELVLQINASYEHERIIVSIDHIAQWKKRDVYDPMLWVKVTDQGRIVASGIAEFDPETKEGVLEWIQVRPEMQGQGLGQAVVRTLLYRLMEKADFVTVSGRVDNRTNPERLYRRCGFEGNDVWCVLTMQDSMVENP